MVASMPRTRVAVRLVPVVPTVPPHALRRVLVDGAVVVENPVRLEPAHGLLGKPRETGVGGTARHEEPVGLYLFAILEPRAETVDDVVELHVGGASEGDRLEGPAHARDGGGSSGG